MGVLCGCYGEKDETDGKRGKPLEYDADFRGPIRGKARRPKDIPCLVLFVVFIIFMLVIGIYAWVNGVPERIVYPTDSRGRLCGVDEAVRDKPYLQFFDLTRCISVLTITELLSGDGVSGIFTCPTPQVCVSECPAANELGVRNNPVCVDSVSPEVLLEFNNITDFDITSLASVTSTSSSVLALLDLIRQEKCAPYYITSAQIARRCIPTVIDLEGQVNTVFNVSSLMELVNQNMTSEFGIDDLIVNLTLQDILDGTATQQILVAARQFLLDVYQDFAVVWPGLLVGLGVAMVLSFLYIILLRWLAGPIIIFGIVLALLLVTTVTAFCYYQFYCFQDLNAIAGQFNNSLTDFINTTTLVGISSVICASTNPLREFIDSQLPWFQYQEYTWLALGIVGTILLLVLIILILVLIKKILISIAIIKEASKAVVGVPTSTFYPLLTWILIVVILLYWGVVAIFLLTASTPTYAIILNGTASEADRNFSKLGVVDNGVPCNPGVDFNDTVFVPCDGSNGSICTVSISCQFDQFVTSNFLLGIQIYHLFGLFWLTNFVLALGEVTLAGGFASWYWAFNKPKDVPTFALVQSFGRAILFHSGSIAFGSLLIALIQLARALLAFAQKKLKDRTGRIGKALLCMLQCCLWCFEKVLRYINRQAYIEIAIYGYDFCTGACKAVKLLLRNIITTAVKDRIVGFLLFLGKIAITGVVGVLAYLGFSGFLDLGTRLWGRPLNYYLLPIIILVLATYIIASGFMSVYHMAVDTIFICALEDLERNNGHDKPFFMSKNLMKLLNAKNFKSTVHPDGEEIALEDVQS